MCTYQRILATWKRSPIQCLWRIPANKVSTELENIQKFFIFTACHEHGKLCHEHNFTTCPFGSPPGNCFWAPFRKFSTVFSHTKVQIYFSNLWSKWTCSREQEMTARKTADIVIESKHYRKKFMFQVILNYITTNTRDIFKVYVNCQVASCFTHKAK